MEDEQNKKVKIMFFAFISIIVLIIIVIVAKNIIENYSSDEYLIVNNSLILEKKVNRWEQITEVTDKITSQKYTLYNDNNVYKNGSLSYTSGQWYYMDENYNNLNNIRVAYSGASDIKLANYKSSYYSVEDESILKEALQSEGITQINNFINSTRKVTYDLDGDGQEETIYTTTNSSLEYTGEKQVAQMFVVKNGKIFQKINHGTTPYFVREVLDMDNDGTYEFVVTKGLVDIPTFDTCYQIYKLKNNKWEITHDCK